MRYLHLILVILASMVTFALGDPFKVLLANIALWHITQRWAQLPWNLRSSQIQGGYLLLGFGLTNVLGGWDIDSLDFVFMSLLFTGYTLLYKRWPKAWVPITYPVFSFLVLGLLYLFYWFIKDPRPLTAMEKQALLAHRSEITGKYALGSGPYCAECIRFNNRLNQLGQLTGLSAPPTLYFGDYSTRKSYYKGEVKPIPTPHEDLVGVSMPVLYDVSGAQPVTRNTSNRNWPSWVVVFYILLRN